MSAVSDKAMSGRWLLTISAGLSLMLFVIADCAMAFYGIPPVIDPMALLGIISIVITFYFAKPPEVKP